MGTSALRLYCRIAAANLEHRLPALARRRKFALTTKIGVDMHWSEFGSSSQDELQHSVVRRLLHQHGQVPLLVRVSTKSCSSSDPAAHVDGLRSQLGRISEEFGDLLTRVVVDVRCNSWKVDECITYVTGATRCAEEFRAVHPHVGVSVLSAQRTHWGTGAALDYVLKALPAPVAAALHISLDPAPWIGGPTAQQQDSGYDYLPHVDHLDLDAGWTSWPPSYWSTIHAALRHRAQHGARHGARHGAQHGAQHGACVSLPASLLLDGGTDGVSFLQKLRRAHAAATAGEAFFEPDGEQLTVAAASEPPSTPAKGDIVRDTVRDTASEPPSTPTKGDTVRDIVRDTVRELPQPTKGDIVRDTARDTVRELPQPAAAPSVSPLPAFRVVDHRRRSSATPPTPPPTPPPMAAVERDTTSDVTAWDVTTSDVGAEADRLIQIRMQALETAEAEIARDRAELALLRRLREENRQLISHSQQLISHSQQLVRRVAALSARAVEAEAEAVASKTPISAPNIKEQRAAAAVGAEAEARASTQASGAAPGASGLALGHPEGVIFAPFKG